MRSVFLVCTDARTTITSTHTHTSNRARSALGDLLPPTLKKTRFFPQKRSFLVLVDLTRRSLELRLIIVGANALTSTSLFNNSPETTMNDLDHTLTERTAARAYKVQTFTAHIGAFMLLADLVLGALEISSGHFTGLLGRIGAGAIFAAVWWSGAFRANLMRHRVTEGRPLELLRRPTTWLPSPFGFARAAIGTSNVQLLPPGDTK